MSPRSQWQGLLLVAPAVLLLIAFTHYPAVATLWHSVNSNATETVPAAFVGLDNYQTMLEDPVFWASLRNNAWFAFITVPASIALAIVMALFVNARLPGKGFLRLAYFTPTVLPMIAVANIWLFFYTPQYGLIAQLLSPFGIASPNWLGDKGTALGAMIVVAIWKEAGALDAHPHLRAGQRADQRGAPGGPHHRHDQGRARQRQLAASLLHLPGWLRLLGRRLRRGPDRRGAGGPGHRCAGEVQLPRQKGALPMSQSSNDRGSLSWLTPCGRRSTLPPMPRALTFPRR
jgi:hypothetical protein